MIGTGIGSMSLALGSLMFCIKKIVDLKSRSKMSQDECDRESDGQNEYDSIDKDDGASVLVIGTAITPTDVDDFDSDFDQSDAYGTATLIGGRRVS